MGVDLLDLSFRINQQFGLSITVQDLPEITGWTPDNLETRPFDITVGQIYEYLLSRLEIVNERQCLAGQMTRNGNWTPSEVWDALEEILVECLCVDREDVRPAARLVADLGAE